jgi:hypothetical protein
MYSLKRVIVMTLAALTVVVMPSVGHASGHKTRRHDSHQHRQIKKDNGGGKAITGGTEAPAKTPIAQVPSTPSTPVAAPGSSAPPAAAPIVPAAPAAPSVTATPAAAPATSATPAPNSVPVYRKVSDRKRFYIEQNKSYTCGPTVIAMAIADHVTGVPPTYPEIDKLTKETGTRESDGMPDYWVVLPQVLPNHGLHFKVYIFAVGDKTAVDALDAELAQGHSAIVHVNNPRTHSGNGHFIYIAGRTSNGGYVIGNPDGPANAALGHDKEVSRQEIENMMVNPPASHPKFYKGQPGFTAVW